MALTGQLSDMSLAELIEFFCNQRKTGRLKIDYPRGHSVFFIKEGELVDAKVGALSGPEAVYFSLTLPNAAFDFSPDVQATRRTIHSAWTQVVLEGLRRLDEGLAPTEADAFGTWSPNESELAQMLDQVEHLDAAGQQKSARDRDKFQREKPARAARPADDSPAADSPARGSSAEPFSMMVESAGGGGLLLARLTLRLGGVEVFDLVEHLRQLGLARRPRAEGVGLGRRKPLVEPAQAFEHDLRPRLVDGAARGLHVGAEVEGRVRQRQREVDGLGAGERADLGVHQLALLDEEDAVPARVVDLEPSRLALVAEELDQLGQRHVAQLSGKCHG